ncbi:C1 family peptidase [Pseudoduganella armeniaca]|uniref:Peptidase C1A papain C-terminal domain-containing protein n=1 Tax=Pseudoduganella armeniaca TaxID=2072590 RepID=A0A2R4CDK4_9BURK|nr:C1 family peptidase [Pseudoduganella armeniaca]AVR97723.1 hypothetical protein C9I28_20350 [Pseudoduganella armeniaca]
MDRRTFIKAGLAEYAALALPVLGGCGGGTDVVVPGPAPGPACGRSGFAMGLSPATTDMLAQIAPRDAVGFSAAATNVAVSALPSPSYFDLTDGELLGRYGFPAGMVPPPSSQGNLSSCVAWGVGYAAMSFMRALETATLAQTVDNQASPADLYAKVLAREAGNGCGNGTYVRDAMDVLVDTGVASLREVPYSDSQCVRPAASARFTLDGYHRLAVADTAAIKSALSNFNVLPFGMQVYPDFQALRGNLVYQHAASDRGCPLGGHCMALIGYSDERAAYRLINSWGSDWGDRGYAWIGYDTFARVASEVYAPYLQSRRGPDTFVESDSAHSGGVSALRAYSRPWRSDASGKWATLYFSFLLDDAMVLTGYKLYFYPTNREPVELGGASNTQVLRGSLLECELPDDLFMRTSASGYFVLNLTGWSRTRQRVNLAIFSRFPDPNGR